MVRLLPGRGRFQVPNGGEVVLLAAEEIDDFDRRAEGGERVDFEDFERFDALEAGVGVFVEQRLEHGAGLVAVFGEDDCVCVPSRPAHGA